METTRTNQRVMGLGALVPFLAITFLYHFQMNGPARPDAQPWDSMVFAVIAGVIVLFNRKALFSRVGSVTEILAIQEDRS